MDIKIIPFENEEAAKYLTVEACENLTRDLNNFKEAVNTLFAYIRKNEITSFEHQEELIKSWQQVCDLSSSCCRKDFLSIIGLLKNANTLEAYLEYDKLSLSKSFKDFTEKDFAKLKELYDIWYNS